MKRRVCIVAVSNDFLAILPGFLQNIAIMAKVEAFACAQTVVRLEGPGLPEWCEEPAGGGAFVQAVCAIWQDGVLRFAPVSCTAPQPPAPENPYDCVKRQFGGNN